MASFKRVTWARNGSTAMSPLFLLSSDILDIKGHFAHVFLILTKNQNFCFSFFFDIFIVVFTQFH